MFNISWLAKRIGCLTGSHAQSWRCMARMHWIVQHRATDDFIGLSILWAVRAKGLMV